MSSRATIPARILEWIGGAWSASLPGQVVSLAWRVAASPFRGRRSTLRQIMEVFLQQTFFTAVEPAPIVLLLAVLIGGVTLVEFTTLLPRLGTSNVLGEVMVLAIVRELGPLFTAFLVAGRSGSALATYIGNMKVAGEVDSLEAMGIDPVRFLVLPAVLGCTIGLTCLSLLFTATAMFGGFFFARGLVFLFPGSLGLETGFLEYVGRVSTALGATDLVLIVAKPAVFGLVIALLACLAGMRLEKSPHEVPQGTRSAVVQSFVSIVLLDGIFATLFVIPGLAGVLP
ncbi:MAG: ABC transporter permease [Fibrobacterota bacterium]|nr:MAG: ABC transporter permease [Fibrobacterota bacterium]